MTTGVALIGTAGAGAEFRDQPGSNGANLGMSVLHFKAAAGVLVTERLSVGGYIGAGLSSLDAPFVGSGAMTTAYSIRGGGGLAYELGRDTTISTYLESKSSFQFGRAIQLLGVGPFLSVDADLPRNVGFGIANSSLMNGRLLIAFDLLYKNWAQTDLFSAIYEDQWAGILGAQLTQGDLKLRLGYAYAPNHMRDVVPPDAGGIPAGATAIQFIQGLAPSIAPHRISAGLTRENIVPGVDLNLFGGTMLNATDTFGDTSVAIDTYWLGGGLTWRFRRGSGCCAAPDEWCDPGDSRGVQ